MRDTRALVSLHAVIEILDREPIANLYDAIREIPVIKAPTTPPAVDDTCAVLHAALRDAIDEYDRMTCHHDDTHRAGFIWTVCNTCGMRWADDKGGFQPQNDPPRIAAARLVVSRYKAGPSTPPEHVGVLVGEREKLEGAIPQSSDFLRSLAEQYIAFRYDDAIRLRDIAAILDALDERDRKHMNESAIIRDEAEGLHKGSSFESFLVEEGIAETVYSIAIERADQYDDLVVRVANAIGLARSEWLGEQPRNEIRFNSPYVPHDVLARAAILVVRADQIEGIE